MEDEKSIAVTSNNSPNSSGVRISNNGSLVNHNNNNDHQPSSSSVSSQKGDELGSDDVGWWDCSLCTYRNSAEKFKCEICDLRRGTSTRKPRCNADTSVDLVMKQQEQIRKQTIVKPTKSRAVISQSATGSTSESIVRTKSSKSKQPKKNRTRHPEEDDTNDRSILDDDTDEIDDELDADSINSERIGLPKGKRKKVAGKKKPSKKQNSNSRQRSNILIESNSTNSDNDSTDATDDLSSTQLHRSASESSLDTSPYSSSSESSPEPTTSAPISSSKNDENPFKITPIEINGKIIKYSPPTESGRTGLIIDKKRFTQHSVTVNDVTITFTEFATRQNKYVRKKKKRSDSSKSKSGVVRSL